MIYGRFALPIYKYDLVQKTMTSSNKEGYLFFGWVCIVQMWGFSATAIAKKDDRYIPISIMGLCLCIAFIYAMTKVKDISTLDDKLFK